MKALTYMRRPFYVDAVQVTSKNMPEVCRWANGRIRVTKQEPTVRYIYVHVRAPMTKKQTQAFVGDWVLRQVSADGVVSFKIYGDDAFAKSFVEVQEVTAFKALGDEQGADLFSPPIGQSAGN
jgi:hypothetical protein